jgi:hypothetical protein
MLYIYADINSGYHLTGGFTEDLFSGWVWLTQGTNKVPACPVQRGQSHMMMDKNVM